MGRRFLIALSLANLMFLRIWRELLNGKLAYYSKDPPNALMGGLILNVLLVAFVFWLVAEIAERSDSKFLKAGVRWVFVIVALLTAQFAKSAVFFETKLGTAGLIVFAVLALAILAIFGKWRDKIAHATAVLFLIVSPFVAVTFAQGLWLLYQINFKMDFADRPRAAMQTGYHGPRVVWMIFDEMDQRQTFLHRDPSVQMPQFDRLRAESFHAENAYPPARATELSLPALLTGKLVSKATPLGANDLVLNLGEEKQQVRWSKQPTIFNAAHDLGMNPAMVGWWHPYCRIPGVADPLVRCQWRDGGLLLGELRRDRPLLRSMQLELLDIPAVTWELRHLPGMPSAGERERAKELDDYEALAPHMLQDAADPSVSLVVLHIGIPHPHGIYDRRTGRFSTDESHGYLDNLALADRTLGEVRAAMEKAGVWDNTVVIASADHWWRSDFWSTHFGWAEDDRGNIALDHRIPFLLKLPGAPQPRTYAPEFNTVLTHDLVLAIVRGEVKDSAGVAAWLDQHKTIGDSPYSYYKKSRDK